MRHPHPHPPALACLGLLMVTLLGACASESPRLDAGWGQSLSQATAGQTAHPVRAPARSTPATTEAVIGRMGIERYHQSFQNPPPAVNVLHLGVGSGGTTASR